MVTPIATEIPRPHAPAETAEAATVSTGDGNLESEEAGLKWHELPTGLIWSCLPSG